MILIMKNLYTFLFAFTMLTSQAQKLVSYADGAQKLEGIVSTPTKKVANGNAVLLLPAWMGIDNNAKENAAELAKIEKELAEEAASLTTLKVDKLVHNFGTILLGSENTCAFKVTNTGDKPLLIADVQASCGCTTPEKPEGPIAPGKSDIIKVGFKPSSRSNDKEFVSKTLTITATQKQVITKSNHTITHWIKTAKFLISRLLQTKCS
jgi:hypothetical protein